MPSDPASLSVSQALLLGIAAILLFEVSVAATKMMARRVWKLDIEFSDAFGP